MNMTAQSRRRREEAQRRYNELAEQALDIVNQNDAVRAQRRREHRVGMSAYAVATRHLNRMHHHTADRGPNVQRYVDQVLLDNPPLERSWERPYTEMAPDGFVLWPVAAGLRRELQNPNGEHGVGGALAGVTELIRRDQPFWWLEHVPRP